MNTEAVGGQFALATVSAAGGPSFAALVTGPDAIAVEALRPLANEMKLPLGRAGQVQEILDTWQENFETLRQIHARIGEDESLYARFRRSFVPFDGLKVHAPLTAPRQIFCSGANYRKHVMDLIVDQDSPENKGMSREERRAYAARVMDKRAATGLPFVFNKLVSSITGPFDPIVLPEESVQPDWELELGVVIGRTARRVSRSEALGYVAGYVVVNDLTERTLVFRPDIPQMGMDWLRSKSAPTFLPMGPLLVPAAFVPDPQALQLTLRLNGEVMQNESTADMIFGVARLIEFLSAHVRLLPGDLILTGSPSGNGTHYNRFLKPGDVLEGSITGLGTQRNPCVAEGI